MIQWKPVLCVLVCGLTFLATQRAGAETVDDPVERLTFSNGAMNGNADIAADGRIAFVSNRSGQWQVWVMAGDGSAPRQFTQETGNLGFASWSDDARAVLFHREVDRRWQLFQVAVDSGEIRAIEFPDADHQRFHRLRPSYAGALAALLYDRRETASDPRRFAITLRPLVGGDERELVAADAYNSDARLSPDGRHIVFHSGRGDDLYRLHYQIHRVDRDGSGRIELTAGERSSKYPKWSPDGRWIVYTSESRENSNDRDVWLMAADGSAPRRLTAHPGLDFDASWSPDGRHLVFATDRFGGRELVRIAVPALDSVADGASAGSAEPAPPAG